MTDTRQRLGELIRQGLSGRSFGGFLRALNRAFRQQGKAYIRPLSVDGFRAWYDGHAFPQTQEKQLILADLVGGWCGEQIRRLQPPPFRMTAQAIAARSHMSKHTNTRNFASFRVVGDDGRDDRRAVIVCVDCDAKELHRRVGTMESEDYFEGKGWQVGKSPTGDKCPRCKEVRMKDQKTPEQAVNGKAAEPPPRTPTMIEMAIIGQKIAENFNEPAKAYNAGWSDQRVAKDLDEPLEVVARKRLEMCPGSTGDDVEAFEILKRLSAVEANFTLFSKVNDDLAASVSSINQQHAAISEMQRAMNLTANEAKEMAEAIRRDVRRINEVMAKISPSMKRAG